MYARGLGVEKNPVEAYKWLTLASRGGIKEAGKTLAEVRKEMAEDQIKKARADVRAFQPKDEAGGSSATAPEPRLVKQAQELLGKLGYDAGRPDGKLKVKTRKAVADFQEAAGLPVTGDITERLVRVLARVAKGDDPGGVRKTRLVGTGTGFVVDRDGRVLTNHHVIDGCREVRIRQDDAGHEATVRATDAGDDLALIEVADGPRIAARFRSGREARPGESVVAFGFPLSSVLASSGTLTTGTISALSGLGNNPKQLQISAPVQPGNSGGPLIDQSGRIVGVVASKLNALKVAQVTGDIPQNVNFAIKAKVATDFLDRHKINYEKAESKTELKTVAIGDQAKDYTVLVECWR
jgi:S1-C subfamily serine protease